MSPTHPHPPLESIESMGFQCWPLLRQILARPWGAVGSPNAMKDAGRNLVVLEVVSSTCLHPGKLTCPLKRDYFNRKYIFQPSFFRGYVSFQGGIWNWRCWFSKIFRLVYSEYWVEKETRSHGFFVNLQLGGGYCLLTESIIPFLPRCSLGNASTVGRRTFLSLQNIKTPKIHHQIFESQLFIFVSTVRAKSSSPKLSTEIQ